MNEKVIQKAWEQAEVVPGFDKKIWRKDFAGAWIKRNLYNKNADLGWKIVPIHPSGYKNYNAVNVQNAYNIKTNGDIFTTPITSHNNVNIQKTQSWRVNTKRCGIRLKYKCEKILPEKKPELAFESKINRWKIVSIAIILIGLSFFYGSNSFLNHFISFNPTVWGTFGDCIFAIVACIMAYLNVILLYNTFKLQIESNKNIQEANEAAERNVLYNKLDTTFKTLMKMYGDKINKRGNSDEPPSQFELHNFDDLNKREIYEERHQIVQKDYETYYADHRPLLSDYFRLVYRIMETIDKAETDDEDKVQYMKIFRSQLNDNELLLLHYNCFTSEGEKMRQYVNKYNILKHLPFMSRYELVDNHYSDWIVLKVNDFLRILQDKFIDSVVDYDISANNQISFLEKFQTTNLSIEVEAKIEHCDEIEVIIIINGTERKELISQTKDFFKRYLLEIFVYSTFEQFQTRGEMQITSTTVDENQYDPKIIFHILKISGNPIVLSYNQLRVPYKANKLRNS